MWNLLKGKYFLPTTSVSQLQKLYDKEKNAKAKLRLLSAVHRKKGKSIDEIAYLLSKPRRTIHGWLVRFQQRGINAKDGIKQSGRPVELTIKQRKNLLKILERGPPHNPSGLWSTKEVRELITKQFKRTYVKQHVWRLLVSVGFSMQRPRKRHYQRPSEKEIARFKKKLGEKQSIIVRKDLLWAHKMKQPLA
ncbi:transposase [Candidatus Woesearchaeota archaeon]|nr:transposase [Candidatus Woesearchaeota archaeon]